MQKSRKQGVFHYLFISFLILSLGVALGYYQITPIKAPSNYGDEQISINDVTSKEADFTMTMSHVYEMAKEPHATGSEEIEKVREYLVKQFEIMDCDYEKQEFTVNMAETIANQVASFNTYIQEHPEKRAYYDDKFANLGFSNYEEKYRSDINCTDTDILKGINYLVKVDAPNTDKGVIFVSHYDSTSNGPGASDDLISVASMLESLREVNTKDKLTNDIYYLFTDAEELNLYGAAAFVEKYTEMTEKVACVINLEARGNSGTLLMFQTSNLNKGIIKAINKAVANTSMFSFLSAIYKTMPNDTDLTEFLNTGYAGMNFAVADGGENYHELTDNYENLDRDSAYMYFKTTVDLADYFSSSNLETLKSNEDAVYFPFLKGNTVIVSNQAMFIFSCFTSIISLFWIVILFLRKESKLKDFIQTISILLASILVTALIGLGGAKLYNIVWDSGEWVDMVGILDIIFYALCFLVILVVLIFVYFAAKRVQRKQTIYITVILILSILNSICIFVLNSLAYIFTIPLFLLVIYSIIQYFIIENNKNKYFIQGYKLILDLIIIVLYTPIVVLLYTALFSSLLYIDLVLICIAVIPVAILYATDITEKNEDSIS